MNTSHNIDNINNMYPYGQFPHQYTKRTKAPDYSKPNVFKYNLPENQPNIQSLSTNEEKSESKSKTPKEKSDKADKTEPKEETSKAPEPTKSTED